MHIHPTYVMLEQAIYQLDLLESLAHQKVPKMPLHFLGNSYLPFIYSAPRFLHLCFKSTKLGSCFLDCSSFHLLSALSTTNLWLLLRNALWQRVALNIAISFDGCPFLSSPKPWAFPLALALCHLQSCLHPYEDLKGFVKVRKLYNEPKRNFLLSSSRLGI